MARANKRTNGPRVETGELRIIAGRFRHRRLRFPALSGLRPTSDRVRETLFNWLQAVLPGARCLDLFAGSGALGFEALSRGAAEVVFVERSPEAIGALRENAEKLQLPRTAACFELADAARYLQSPASPFDIVFLDPPFDSGMLASSLVALDGAGWLAPGALVYVEAPADGLPPLPNGWAWHRSQQAGRVAYALARKG